MRRVAAFATVVKGNPTTEQAEGFKYYFLGSGFSQGKVFLLRDWLVYVVRGRNDSDFRVEL